MNFHTQHIKTTSLQEVLHVGHAPHVVPVPLQHVLPQAPLLDAPVLAEPAGEDVHLVRVQRHEVGGHVGVGADVAAERALLAVVLLLLTRDFTKNSILKRLAVICSMGAKILLRRQPRAAGGAAAANPNLSLVLANKSNQFLSRNRVRYVFQQRLKARISPPTSILKVFKIVQFF